MSKKRCVMLGCAFPVRLDASRKGAEVKKTLASIISKKELKLVQGKSRSRLTIPRQEKGVRGRGIVGRMLSIASRIAEIPGDVLQTFNRGNMIYISTKGRRGKNAYFGDDVVVEWNAGCRSLGGLTMKKGKIREDTLFGIPVDADLSSCPFKKDKVKKDAVEINLSPKLLLKPRDLPPLSKLERKEADAIAGQLFKSFNREKKDCARILKNTSFLLNRKKYGSVMEVIREANLEKICNIPIPITVDGVHNRASRQAYDKLVESVK